MFGNDGLHVDTELVKGLKQTTATFSVLIPEPLFHICFASGKNRTILISKAGEFGYATGIEFQMCSKTRKI